MVPPGFGSLAVTLSVVVLPVTGLGLALAEMIGGWTKVTLAVPVTVPTVA